MAKADQKEEGMESPKPTILHFSHSHPLELTNLSTLNINGKSQLSCSGCKQKLSSKYAYCCLSCNYFLHASCSQLPPEVRHPVDKDHPLCLSAVAPYPGGVFKCSGCSEPGSGFYYACGSCRLELHAQCANMPLHIRNPAHRHPLELSVAVARGGMGFFCLVCGKYGRKSWRYRCKSCVFDAHPGCVLDKNPPPEPEIIPEPSERSIPEEKKGSKSSLTREIGGRVMETAAVAIVSNVIGSMFS
ncbi:uncharacterized protein LOC116247025 [Nymphaea colorata]|nr:uncharacterized protein LOC116247025 [Nymphaea colorata]